MQSDYIWQYLNQWNAKQFLAIHDLSNITESLSRHDSTTQSLSQHDSVVYFNATACRLGIIRTDWRHTQLIFSCEHPKWREASPPIEGHGSGGNSKSATMLNYPTRRAQIPHMTLHRHGANSRSRVRLKCLITITKTLRHAFDHRICHLARRLHDRLMICNVDELRRNV